MTFIGYNIDEEWKHISTSKCKVPTSDVDKLLFPFISLVKIGAIIPAEIPPSPILQRLIIAMPLIHI
jgi:hypothetical protein